MEDDLIVVDNLGSNRWLRTLKTHKLLPTKSSDATCSKTDLELLCVFRQWRYDVCSTNAFFGED
jgi:hypothetical protein